MPFDLDLCRPSGATFIFWPLSPALTCRAMIISPLTGLKTRYSYIELTQG